METIGLVLTLGLFAAVWIAAVVFGRDSRDGRDWFARGNPPGRTPRIGD